MNYGTIRNLLAAVALAAGGAACGQIVGLAPFELPEWFKNSFMEIDEDAAEAAESGKHLMAFFHLENCPYCERMLVENFVAGAAAAESIDERFDVVAINSDGSVEVTDDGEEFTEKEYARRMGAAYTPTIIFYDAAGDPITKVVGYRAPEAFAAVLDYVSERAYADDRYLDLSDYVASRDERRWDLRIHPRFVSLDDLGSADIPLMIIIEDSSCVECERLHERLLALPDIQEHLDGVAIVRLDADSERPIAVPDGRRMSERDFVRELGITYRPGVVFYDGADRIFDITGALNPYHFREAVRYVAGGHHHQYDRWGAYLRDRRQQIIADGGEVDYSFAPATE